jgi:hypothetical protein
MLKIEEKYSPHWKVAVFLSLILAGLFFGIFLILNDPFWEGIFRIGAFISFTVSVVCALKVTEGKHALQLSVEDGQLVVSFRKNNKEIQRDLFELENIAGVHSHSRSSSDGLSDPFFRNDMVISLTLKDSDQSLTLFKLNGRTLAVSRKNAGKVIDYIQSELNGVS